MRALPLRRCLACQRAAACAALRILETTPKYVKAYVKRGKTDAGDAAAICEAVT